MFTTPEHLEILGNLLLLENSGELREFEMYSENFYYIRCHFFEMQSETHNKKMGNLTFPLKAKADRKYGKKMPKWLLRLILYIGFTTL